MPGNNPTSVNTVITITTSTIQDRVARHSPAKQNKISLFFILYTLLSTLIIPQPHAVYVNKS
nr:MAG TPA: hypothetical protein [Caudoviricetes sp.]